MSKMNSIDRSQLRNRIWWLHSQPSSILRSLVFIDGVMVNWMERHPRKHLPGDLIRIHGGLGLYIQPECDLEQLMFYDRNVDYTPDNTFQTVYAMDCDPHHCDLESELVEKEESEFWTSQTLIEANV